MRNSLRPVLWNLKRVNHGKTRLNMFNNDNLGNRSLIDWNSRSYVQHGNSGPSFWQDWKNLIKKNMRQDKKLMEDLDALEKGAVGKSYKITKDAASKTKDKIKPVFEKGGELGEKILEKSEDSKFARKFVDMTDRVSEKVASNKYVKYVVDELTHEERMRRKLSYIFRSKYGRDEDKRKGVFWNPYTGKMEKFESEKYDTASTDVVIKDPNENKRKPPSRLKGLRSTLNSALTKLEGNENPLAKTVHSLTASTKKVVDRVGESALLRTTEESEVFSTLKEVDETFDLDVFQGNLEHIVIPEVLRLYFDDDIEGIKRWVSEECYKGFIAPHIKSRQLSNTKFDTKILAIQDVELYFAKFIQEEPILTFSANVNYIYCIKDGNGKIIEGGSNDIRSENHSYSLRQDPTGETKDWEIHAISFGHAQKIL